jgi:phosphatidylserine decarboxylase
MCAKGCAHWVITPALIGLALVILNVVIYYDNFILRLLLYLAITISFTIAIFFTIFFRDPERKIGDGIVAPADGKIIGIYEHKSDNTIQIATFMRLTDVHVNRMPLHGTIVSIQRTAGEYLPAYIKDSEKRNTRMCITVATQIGKLKIIQVAGIFARRIVSYVQKGQVLKKGARIGIVRFGSRVDLYLPSASVKVIVVEGQKVIAGSSTIAHIVNNSSAQK